MKAGSAFEDLYSKLCKRESVFFHMYIGRPEAELGTETGVGNLGEGYFYWERPEVPVSMLNLVNLCVNTSLDHSLIKQTPILKADPKT